jgi:RNA polymerase sigma-70 factor (ECF subfamily)
VGGLDQAGDQALAEAAQEGSAAAFARIVERHQAAVRGFLRRLCGSHADADDLAQDTFVSAWSRIGSFRAGESLRAWLCGVAYRKWLTHRRALARRGAREAQAAEEASVSAAPAPDARLDAATALGFLGPEPRACVALCLAAGFSHAEAARALDLPVGTVKSHVARGRAKLLEVLGGAG